MLAWAAGSLGALRRDPKTSVVFAVAIACAVAGVLLAARRAWLCDDAFITFRYARNWASGAGLVYNAGEFVEGYSHPLWLLLIAAAARFATPERAAVALGLAAFAIVL